METSNLDRMIHLMIHSEKPPTKTGIWFKMENPTFKEIIRDGIHGMEISGICKKYMLNGWYRRMIQSFFLPEETLNEMMLNGTITEVLWYHM